VPKLKPSNISIVDERGTLLSRSFENDDAMVAAQQDEALRGMERRLAQSVTSLVESSLGPGKVRAEVRAEMEFDKVVTAAEEFNPDQAVVRSSVTVTDTSTQQETDPTDVTVANQLPDATANTGGAARMTTNEERTEETVNYDISKVTTNRVKEAGSVRRLSVAVLVDGNYTTNPETNERTYQPLADDTMEKIRALVNTAVGYSADRGDQIEVVNMPFSGFDDLLGAEDEFSLLGFNKEEIMRMAEGLGVAVVAVLVILLVVRPLVTRAFEAMPQGDEALLTTDGAMAQLTGPGGVPMPMGQKQEEEDLDELIDIDKVVPSPGVGEVA
jgi:flagellar M-ring protein FliF